MGEYPYTHDYTAEIETLRREVVALTYRAPGDASSPSALDEVIEAVAVVLEELHVANEALIQTQQVAQHEQQRYRVGPASHSHFQSDLEPAESGTAVEPRVPARAS